MTPKVDEGLSILSCLIQGIEGCCPQVVVIRKGTGDFAHLWTGLMDLDTCRDNFSTQEAFIDDGQVVPGTGGSPCITWCYGPGGWIVNTTGGLAGPDEHIQNAPNSSRNGGSTGSLILVQPRQDGNAICT